MNWYDKQVERLEKDYENGGVSEEDFDLEMKYLNESLRQEAEEQAERAYNDVMGY